MRDVKTLAKEIDGFTLETSIRRKVRRKNADGSATLTTKTETVPLDKGISALGAHIRATWTIGEILFFKSFTHGGTFTAPDGGWRVDYSGYVAATAEGMRNLVRLFDSLHAEIWAYMGATLYARMDSKRHKMTLMNDADGLMETIKAAGEEAYIIGETEESLRGGVRLC